MAYVNRRFTKRRSGSAELLYLLIVLAAGFTTAWWASHKLGMDLSSVTTFGTSVGGVAKISPDGLRAVDSIHASGKAPIASSSRPPP